MSTFEMYQQVRKLNPDVYYDTKTQKQMRKDLKRLGDALFTQQLFTPWRCRNDTHLRLWSYR